MPNAAGWRLPDRTLKYGAMPLLMGVVNVTPDSFSDGGRFFEPAAAVRHGLSLVRQGADILDIGGESTRPGAEEVSADEEIDRVIPVLERLHQETEVPLSIDTSKAVVAREAIGAGVSIVNDVTALEGDPEMLDVVRTTDIGVCLMHMRGTPRTMQHAPQYDDVVEEVLGFLRQRRDALIVAGVSQDRIVVDPGIGFGKTLQHNLALLRGVRRFRQLGCGTLVGMSRKAFIGHLLGDTKRDRTAGTIGVALALAEAGVEVLRLHDPGTIREAITLFRAVRCEAT